jgi:cell division protein FtsQ
MAYARRYYQASIFEKVSIGNLLSNLIASFSVAIVLFSVTYGGLWLSEPQRFPITSVKILGAYHHLSRDELQEVVSQQVSAGFFALKVLELRAAIESLAWVKHASVRRVWPSQVLIQLEEEVAFARWNQDAIVTLSGALISPPQQSFPKDLPFLEGPKGRYRSVWEQYRVMSEILAPTKLSIKRLQLATRGSWKLTLDNGIQVILGKTEVLVRLRRFTETYQRVLGAVSEKLSYVDLRYTSGLAVGWKTMEAGRLETKRLLNGENPKDV